MVAVLPPRDEQAVERRRQLVRIASDLIEEGGVDAVTLPRVTERAGCARTLVYRYFASREDLLVGVLRDYFERLDARMPEAEQRAALDAFLADVDRADQTQIRELIAVFWDVQVAAGLGGAILRATPRLNPQIAALVDESRRTYERRITDALRGAGLGAMDAQVALDSMIASFVGLALRWRAGEIDRDAAIAIHARATVGLVRGLLGSRVAVAAPAKTLRGASRSVPRARRRS
jgi:AcrR family transcriptional regulator